MKILFVRHAAAVPHGTPGVLDAERPLTAAARAKFSIAARGIARIVGRVDVLLTSPLARAHETAEIVAQMLTPVDPVVEPTLAGERADAVMSALALHPPAATIALVGGAPVLAALLAHMLGSSEAAPFTFRRGGAALVDLPDGPAGSGRLVWFLPPRVLRALAGAVEIVVPSPIENGQATAARSEPS